MLKNEINENEALSIARVSGSTFVNADCFDVFPFIENKSIDAIICDLPYGTTQCKWDSILPFDKLWKEYKRVIKPNGVIILFGSEPFSSALRMSNIKNYKYDWIWHKNKPSGALNSKFMPMQNHETISVFYYSKPFFNSILEPRDATDKTKNNLKNKSVGKFYGSNTNGKANGLYTENKNIDFRKATTVKYFKCVPQKQRKHSTEKPIELMEYLVKTYTNEGDMVLDNTMGSGTTILAAIKNNRIGIGIEKEKQYYDVAVRRALEYCH